MCSFGGVRHHLAPFSCCQSTAPFFLSVSTCVGCCLNLGAKVTGRRFHGAAEAPAKPSCSEPGLGHCSSISFLILLLWGDRLVRCRVVDMALGTTSRQGHRPNGHRPCNWTGSDPRTISFQRAPRFRKQGLRGRTATNSRNHDRSRGHRPNDRTGTDPTTGRVPHRERARSDERRVPSTEPSNPFLPFTGVGRGWWLCVCFSCWLLLEASVCVEVRRAPLTRERVAPSFMCLGNRAPTQQRSSRYTLATTQAAGGLAVLSRRFFELERETTPAPRDLSQPWSVSQTDDSLLMTLDTGTAIVFSPVRPSLRHTRLRERQRLTHSQDKWESSSRRFLGVEL